MEKGDISQPVSYRNVVTMMPTLVVLPHHAVKLRRRYRRNSRRIADILLETSFIGRMFQWMEHQAYFNSATFEVWHVAPTDDFESELYDALVERCDAYIERSVSFWGHYTEDTARALVTASPHISTVYDADHSRLERCWPFRGHRVPLGGAP